MKPYLLALAALLIALLLSLAFGAVFIPPGEIARVLGARLAGELGADSPAATIVLAIRLPRTALVALTGAALGGSGAAYQGLFRNPLADPYLMGVASGAGLAAVLAIGSGAPATLFGLATVPAAAFTGALATVSLVYALARVGRAAPVTTLILAGVAVGSFSTALTTFLLLRSTGESLRALGWLLGSFSQGGWAPVLAELPYIVIGLGVLIALGRPLNVLQFGDDQARQLGLDVERLKFVLVAAASLATAAAVAFAGVIGFVGLAVPHLVRLLWGPDYRHLLPLSVLGGAAALLLADVAARLVLAPQEVPVGIITALAGAPFFLYLLRTAKNEAFW